MRIGILGTGTLAEALAMSWARAGHEVAVGGRSQAKARALAERLGNAVHAVPLRDVARGRDAVLLAVLWDGVEEILHSAGAADGALAGTPLIDPTNAVEHGVGVLLTERVSSGAQQIAKLAPGAHVVKAFHLRQRCGSPARGGRFRHRARVQGRRTQLGHSAGPDGDHGRLDELSMQRTRESAAG